MRILLTTALLLGMVMPAPAGAGLETAVFGLG